MASTSDIARFGRIGIWRGDAAVSVQLAVELERLGFGTLWLGGSPDGHLEHAEELLEATSRLHVATGIVNIWKDPAELVARSYHRLEDRFGDRFLLGIGVGHPEATSDYRRPYAALVDYLDALDAAGVAQDRRVLAALGPKVLRLARDRSLGAHPYLTPPAHTRTARELMGPGPFLVPEQKVVLDTDPVAARAVGRPVVEKPYLGLVNYTNNLRSLGYSDADLANGGSDRLIDDLVAHGDVAYVAARLREHLDAGADQVTIQLLTAADVDPVEGYRSLASALLDG